MALGRTEKPAAAARIGSYPPPRRRGIPRTQLWLFWFLLLSVAAMAAFLIRLRGRVDDRYLAASQPLPLTAANAPVAPLRLYLANDADGSIAEKPLRFPLPAEPNARARVVLEKLLEEYAEPGSTHPLLAGAEDAAAAGIEDVYLLAVPGTGTGAGTGTASASGTGPKSAPGPGPEARARGELAVVNLSPAFVENHPSGIEPETLTLLSMIATLKANVPEITEVRFLVDGREKETLAGHADLTRTYLAGPLQTNGGRS